ncbi:muts domain V-domain-containing protein [Emericellopsis atlantica]|uniref:DNA mismatch repair protein MSH3 n=1 Tax=Emericellopsis atlantica TaxID=2614577 RepID=A0A9P7ZE56_9HYPO|nr:muts domain V-domain-containing protein [Emericellopsis atlantica]KAG9250345.1 muts domain V-domain-containing protein [Emericellopsis atlantica]
MSRQRQRQRSSKPRLAQGSAFVNRSPLPDELLSQSPTHFTGASNFRNRSSSSVRPLLFDVANFSEYAHSTVSSSPGASRPSTTRPPTRATTASGRKSRASASTILGQSERETVICAVSEARGVTPSVGVAFVNVTLSKVTMSQICDNQSYVKSIHEIQMNKPTRIIFMSTACPPSRPSTLYGLVNNLIPEASIDVYDRAAWSESSGLDLIRNLAFETDVSPLTVALQGKYYATSSFYAAMKYIEHHFAITFVPHSLRISYQPSDGTMMIDISAFQSLEIMQNSRDPKSKDSLFGLLNQTTTPMGTRMLRRNILQPPTHVEAFVRPRHDALEELTTNEELFQDIRRALKAFSDVEKLLTKLIIVNKNSDVRHVEEQINQVLMMKSFLEAIPELYQALVPARSPLLTKARDICHPEITGGTLDRIRQVIEADVTYTRSPLDLRNQRTFAVKAGISGMLDVARQMYKELTEEIHKHVDEVNERFKSTAALKFDNGRKYWLRIKASDFDGGRLPDCFVNVVRKRDKIECQTLDLIKLNLRLSDTSNEVVIRSDAVIDELIADIRLAAPQFFRVCESVAMVDMISAFGQLATTRDYVKPEIAGTLALKAARHPIREKKPGAEFIPNDYYSTEQYCFHIVTGSNMSGKSTYIRSIALLQIMAQIGSFVPAEYAAFSIIHQMFARVSMDDSIESNLSTFSVEMQEMVFILRNINDRSLAIIDELGRGTSSRDGLAIAIAMSEALIQSKASVWFATHFIELARALADRPGVLNLHLLARNTVTADGLPQITMLYKVDSGYMDDEVHYGINLARAIGLPKSFTDKAEEVANYLRTKRAANQQGSESRKLMARRRLILNLHEALKQAKEAADPAVLPGYLQRLQEQFITRMEELDQL